MSKNFPADYAARAICKVHIGNISLLVNDSKGKINTKKTSEDSKIFADVLTISKIFFGRSSGIIGIIGSLLANFGSLKKKNFRFFEGLQVAFGNIWSCFP